MPSTAELQPNGVDSTRPLTLAEIRHQQFIQASLESQGMERAFESFAANGKDIHFIETHSGGIGIAWNATNRETGERTTKKITYDRPLHAFRGAISFSTERGMMSVAGYISQMSASELGCRPEHILHARLQKLEQTSSIGAQLDFARLKTNPPLVPAGK